MNKIWDGEKSLILHLEVRIHCILHLVINMELMTSTSEKLPDQFPWAERFQTNFLNIFTADEHLDICYVFFSSFLSKINWPRILFDFGFLGIIIVSCDLYSWNYCTALLIFLLVIVHIHIYYKIGWARSTTHHRFTSWN